MNIYSNLFDSMVNHMYPSQLQLNKVNVSDTDVSFLDSSLLISDDFVKPKNLFLFLLLAVPRRLFCFGSLVILDVARCYLWLFTLYISMKIGKNNC